MVLKKLITFGRFYSEEIFKKQEKEKEKELFLEYKKDFIYSLTAFEISTKSLEGVNEITINEMISKYLKQNKMISPFALNSFMEKMGLSYQILNKDEINEIEKMEFTYENWEEKSNILFNNYVKKSRDIFPNYAKDCFDDKCFTVYVLIEREDVFKKYNFVRFIRDYFILDRGKSFFDTYRDKKIFNDLRNKMIDKYPKLKEDYGTNKYIDKFFSYLLPDSDSLDYNKENIKKILDNYYNNNYNKNEDEFKKLKTD